jgi:acetyl-CoA carboxylase carboxyltransferase component
MLFASLGGLLCFVGAIWLVVIAIQTGQTTGEKVLWALVNFLCQPLGGIIFFIVKRQGLVPLLLVIIGTVLGGFGYSSAMSQMMRDLPH